MPILRMKSDDPQPDDEVLQEGLSTLASDDDAMRFVKAMLHLLKSGDLGFWLSPRLGRKVKALGQQRQGKSSPSNREIDEEAFVLFLQQGGKVEPNVRWDVESLPNNGGIYRILLEGGQDGKGVHDHQG